MKQLFLPSKISGLILDRKGHKQTRAVISWQRGKNDIALCPVSGCPPMLTHPGKRMSPELQKNGPGRAVFSCYKNWWIAIELFGWFLHFKQFTKLSNGEVLLLQLDNHTSHISFCRDNGIIMVPIPTHTSQRS